MFSALKRYVKNASFDFCSVCPSLSVFLCFRPSVGWLVLYIHTFHVDFTVQQSFDKLANNVLYFHPRLLPETLFVPEMDLAFVISTTAVDQDKNFEKTKEIIKETVEKFGLHRVRYSLIAFGATPDVRIRFDNVFDTEEELGKLVDNVKKAMGDAALDKALEEARYLYALAEDARPNAMKVLVVITDKKSDSTEENVQVASKKLKDDGVRVIAIALGDESDPVSPEVIKPETDTSPKEVVKQLVNTVLNGLCAVDFHFINLMFKSSCRH